MIIFIIFGSQKTRGRVAGNLARLHATHIVRPSRRAWHCALILLRTYIYALLVYLGAVAQRKER